MKIEGETIVIRVGGGYLTIEDFIEHYCGGEDEQRSKISSIAYGGQCSGNKEFKTFYFTNQAQEELQELDNKSPFRKEKGRGVRTVGLTLEEEQPRANVR